MPTEAISYHDLHRKFTDSLRIPGEKLKSVVEDRNFCRGLPQIERCCRAAIHCLGDTTPGANNLRSVFFSPLPDNRFRGEKFGGPLVTFFRQFPNAVIVERGQNPETISWHELGIRWSSLTLKQYDDIAFFFSHQAEFAVSGDGIAFYVSVLRDLLKKWWDACDSSDDNFNAANRDESAAWFQRNLDKLELKTVVLEGVPESFVGGELPPPAIGTILQEDIIGERIQRKTNRVFDRDDWETYEAVGDVPEFIHAAVAGYFSPTNNEFVSDEELAMEVLVSGAPTAQWEVACAAAGLVKFEWMPKEEETKHV